MIMTALSNATKRIAFEFLINDIDSVKNNFCKQIQVYVYVALKNNNT